LKTVSLFFVHNNLSPDTSICHLIQPGDNFIFVAGNKFQHDKPLFLHKTE